MEYSLLNDQFLEWSHILLHKRMAWQGVGSTLTIGGQNFELLPNGAHRHAIILENSFKLKFGIQNSVLTLEKVI